MFLTWAFALLASYGLRFWGFLHPGAFVIRPFLVFGLLIGPSIGIGIWVLVKGFPLFGSTSIKDENE